MGHPVQYVLFLSQQDPAVHLGPQGHGHDPALPGMGHQPRQAPTLDPNRLGQLDAPVVGRNGKASPDAAGPDEVLQQLEGPIGPLGHFAAPGLFGDAHEAQGVVHHGWGRSHRRAGPGARGRSRIQGIRWIGHVHGHAAECASFGGAFLLAPHEDNAMAERMRTQPRSAGRVGQESVAREVMTTAAGTSPDVRSETVGAGM